MKPLRCSSCASPVALGPGAELTCPSCSSAVAVPEDLREAQNTLALRSETRRQLEPLWGRLGHPPSRGWTWLGVAMVLLMPSLATGVAAVVSLDAGLVAATVTFPSVLPGAVIWLGAAAMRTTTLQMQLDMAAVPTDTGHACRSCGAPLALDTDAISASCGYCGADSVVSALPAASISRAQARALIQTVEEAMVVLRRRRALIFVGLAALTLPIGATSMAIGVATWLVGST
ncbi:MAG: hypothetical protein KC912_25370 [Proteobacteria bacterium]|nr:hypothetical protein [Pseudomonadota bacterium]